MKGNQPTLILEIGAEGGSIRVFRDTPLSTPTSRFCATMLDQTPLLLNQDDGGGSEIRRQSGWISWAEAMAWIGRYPWPCLHALKVDPSVADSVWTAAEERMHTCITAVGGRSLDRWRRFCNRPDGQLPHKLGDEHAIERETSPPPARPPQSGDRTGLPADRQGALKDLIARGKAQGYLTYAQLNDSVPSEIVDPEQIDDIVNTINDMGIPVYENAPD